MDACDELDGVEDYDQQIDQFALLQWRKHAKGVQSSSQAFWQPSGTGPIITSVDRRGSVLVPYPFGTSEWAQFVFSHRPSQDPFKGNRPAERGVLKVGGELHVTEGHERVALYVLEHLLLTGTLSRIKSQPFSWLVDGSDHLRTPDFLVQTADGGHLIVQVSAHRFVSREKEARFESERRQSELHGVGYLVWTDQTFLSRPIRNLFTALRATRSDPASNESLDQVCAAVTADGGHTSLDRLMHRGHDASIVLKSVRSNRLFISLYEPLHVDSIVSLRPVTDPRVFLLDRGYHTSQWWNLMQGRQGR